MLESDIEGETDSSLTFPGKIAVITSYLTQSEDDFHSADYLLAKYGPGKILHSTLPINFVTDRKQVIDITLQLGKDKDLKVLIFNQAAPGTNAAIEKIRETRDDIFIVSCTIHESVIETSKLANLILSTNDRNMGSAMLKQAKKQGAKVFIYYSFPRHMAMERHIHLRKGISETCTSEGIQFIDVTALDPTEVGIEQAHKFIHDSVPKLAAAYGEDTAFFCTNCNLQAPLIKAVVNCHAIYPQPCCPSPYHGFPEAFGIDKNKGRSDLHYLIDETSRIVKEKHMTDRLSSWPVSASAMFTSASAEYGLKWAKSEVQKKGIDDDVLLDCMNDYIEKIVGERSCIFMNSHSENGVTYHNCKLLLMGYLDY